MVDNASQPAGTRATESLHASATRPVTHRRRAPTEAGPLLLVGLPGHADRAGHAVGADAAVAGGGFVQVRLVVVLGVVEGGQGGDFGGDFAMAGGFDDGGEGVAGPGRGGGLGGGGGVDG